jgi:hypothetical protein
MEMLLTVLTCSALFVAIGFMNRGRDEAEGCGHCDGACVDESDCKFLDLGDVRS